MIARRQIYQAREWIGIMPLYLLPQAELDHLRCFFDQNFREVSEEEDRHRKESMGQEDDVKRTQSGTRLPLSVGSSMSTKEI